MYAEKTKNSERAMTSRELKNLYYLKKEIKEQQRRIAELEAVATNCSTKITGLPSGKGISDKIGNYAAQIADLKALLDLNLKKCFYEFNRLNRYIEEVEEPLIKQNYDIPICERVQLAEDCVRCWWKQYARWA